MLDDDFNTPAALAVLHQWAREGALDELRRGLAIFGLGSLGDSVEAPAERRRAAPRGAGGTGGGATSRSRTGCATRSPPPDGRCGTCQRTASSSCRCGDPRARSTAATPCARRCAAGARCSSCGCPSGPPPRSTGSARALVPQAVKERELTEAAGSPDHQGVVAWASPYPVRGSLGAGCTREAAARRASTR